MSFSLKMYESMLFPKPLKYLVYIKIHVTWFVVEALKLFRVGNAE